jgi:hypothetical protein
MWASGEIWLAAGMHQLTLTADGRGVFEVGARDGTELLITASYISPGAGAFVVPADGWYPVRMAVSDDTGPHSYRVTDDPPGLVGAERIERSQFRVAVNHHAGALVTGTDRYLMVEPVASDLHESDFVDADWDLGVPIDLSISNIDGFSTRWEGQFFVDVAGDYTFRVMSDDGQRLWIDGVLAIDAWVYNMVTDRTTAPIALDVGWHDIALQHTEGAGGARLSLAIESAPTGVALGAIPRAKLRPVTGGARIALTHEAPNANPDYDERFAIVTGGAGAVATEVIVGFLATTSNWRELDVDLVTPLGTSVTVFDVNNNTTPDTQLHTITLPSATGVVDGTWTLRFDYGGGGGGPGQTTIDMASLGIYYGGGFPTIAPIGTWTSEVHDLGAVLEIQSVTWEAVLPSGSGLAVESRTCDDAACSADPPWVVVGASGDQPATPRGQWAQLRASFSTGGTAEPWLEWIDVIAR